MSKALLVDDDIPTTEVLSSRINWTSFNIGSVQAVYNIRDAMTIMERDVPELVICDIEMPKGTGLDLIRWAREKKIESKFIFITCHDNFSFISEAMDFQAVAYLTKPFNPVKTEEAISKAVEIIKQEKRNRENDHYVSEIKRSLGETFIQDFLGRTNSSEEKSLSGRGSEAAEEAGQEGVPVPSRPLDREKIRIWIIEGRAVEIAEYIKAILERPGGKPGKETLGELIQDYLQIVYAVLYEQRIPSHLLLDNPSSRQIADAAENSVFDAMRWITHATITAINRIKENLKQDSRVEKMVRYINEHYAEDITRDTIASHVYLTANYVSKIFKSEKGCYLKDYINEVRINKAKELFKTTQMNVSEVAMAVGIDNFSYFSTLFRKAIGISPSSYRSEGVIL